MNLNRREALSLVTSLPLALAITPEEAAYAASRVAQAKPYALRFFTPKEYATVVALSDLIIPRDAKSGSASESGAPEFIDFIVAEQPGRQTAMRGGLAWLDRECVTRFDKDFLTCTPAERTQVLDDISWPHKAKPEHAHGVAFFNSFRDLTASGFFTSKIGMADLEYKGNTIVPIFKGCPPEWLKKLGV
jgi:hypothetical protein